MAKHTLEILQCSYRKTFKVCLAIFQHMPERVNKRPYSYWNTPHVLLDPKQISYFKW